MEVRKVCHVTLDTSIEPVLLAHHLDGSIMKFEEKESDLYIYKRNSNTSINVISHCTLVTTIEENKKMLTKRQVCNAKLAQNLYHKIGRPGEDAFEDILWTNKINNCLITVDDARHAVAIYGPEFPKLKGTTTAGPPVAHVSDQNLLAVP